MKRNKRFRIRIPLSLPRHRTNMKYQHRTNMKKSWIIINGFFYKFLNGNKYISFSEAFTSQACHGLGSSFSLLLKQMHFQRKITSFGTGITLGMEHVSCYFVKKNYCVTRGNLSTMSKDKKNRSFFPLICLLTLSCSRGK